MTNKDKISKLIIVAVDSKFKKFDYDRFEIEYLKQYTNVVIWDLSLLSSIKFNKGISASQYSGDDIKIISSYRKLILEFNYIKNKYYNKNVFIMNFVTPGYLSSLFFLIVQSKLGFNSVTYDNSGVPLIWTKNIKRTIKYTIKNILKRFYILIFNFTQAYPNYCIYAGDQKEKNKNSISKIKKKTKFLAGNSWDYNKILLNIKSSFNQTKISKKKVVLLDGAGPMFGSDDIAIGKKTFLTVNKWYPSLNLFLDKIEKKANLEVEIAAHPKTSYKKNDLTFGGRNVVYGKTLELVRNSDFVITRQSTAISYAIFFKKPVIFIYSNELKKDSLAMAGVNKISKLLNTIPINIDENLEDISKYLNVDKLCYEAYIKNYLTSTNSSKTNAQILLKDIMMLDDKTF